jgi:hypothetical protein
MRSSRRTNQRNFIVGLIRQVRIAFEEATYHTMSRGDQREAIFVDEAVRLRWSAAPKIDSRGRTWHSLVFSPKQPAAGEKALSPSAPLL